ncbi:RBBP9/YdeN family alpha/beta hydrolase [Saccharothrix lopnurensis]|uniref:RBBP9/YdeN family alpha/beta hydrolase n=1 Tax=Saccharothrix lopnurensis TaxID=1670621 RepID=A0ABW1P5E0_9PSEU
MSLPHVLVLPGLGGAGPAHWQNWLAGELARHGGSVDVPEFSAPDAPRLDVWLDELRGHLAAARVSSARVSSGQVSSGQVSSGQERVVVAHSLACLLWLHHAAGEFDGALRVDRVLLVAPPAPGPAGEPFARGFPHPVPDPVSVRRAAVSTRLVVGEGDPCCSLRQAKGLAEALRLDLDVVVGGGRLDEESGYGSWGSVLKWARSGRTPLTPR